MLFEVNFLYWSKQTSGGRIIMVFYYQNGSDLHWEKIVLSDQEKLLKFEAEGQELAKFLQLLKQFIQTEKGQNNSW